MIDYGTCQAAAYQKRERNDCAVKAVAVTTQTPYEEVHALFKALGRRDRGRTMDWVTVQAVLKLGYTRIPREVDGKTIRTAAPKLTNGRYLVFVRGHVLAVVDGKTEDWSDGRLNRIKCVYEVAPIE